MERFPNIDNLSAKTIEQDRVIDALHGSFERQKKIYQPKPENFLGTEGFDDVAVKQEIALAASLKEKWENQNTAFEQKNKKISDVFEGIIVDQFCGAWMSNQAEAFFTAEPDDFIRKVDCVIEFHPEEGKQDRDYLGLGIDVTFSSDYSTISGKLHEVWSDVERSKKVQVKYVDTEHFKGSLEVSRVVLAADKETVLELARLYKEKDREALDNHPYLANAMLQMKHQLEAYYSFAQKKHARAGYLQHLTETLRTFYRVLDAKEWLIGNHVEEVEKSDVYKTIKEYCMDKLGGTEIKYGNSV